MAGIINTKKMLSNDSFYNGGIDSEVLNNEKIELHPFVCSQYNYSVTEDPVADLEQEDTERKLYDIFRNSPFYKEYTDDDGIIKIPKEDTSKVFYYTKTKLEKEKKLSAYEMVIAINEFFDFNYEYVVKKVLSSKMMADILNEYYCNGMSRRIDEDIEEQVF